MPKPEIADNTTLCAIAEALNVLGIRAASRQQCHAMTVQNLLARGE